MENILSYVSLVMSGHKEKQKCLGHEYTEVNCSLPGFGERLEVA